MTVSAHVRELQNRHADLDAKIKRELKSPNPDTIRLSSLKKRKLHLKDQIKNFA